MNNTPLAKKIVAARKSQGLSQEALAEKASINLRTLQRLENGETEPRGQTLRLIAQALDQPLEDFLDFTKEEDKGFLQLLNLSTLSFWIIPLGNIFIPLVLWVMKKDKIKGAGELGRRIINFQITWSFVTFGIAFTYMFAILLGLSEAPIFSPFYILLAIASLYILNSVLILIASFQINRGVERIYTVGIKIIR